MSIRVLVVDDSPAVRLVLRSALVRIGLPNDHILDTEDAIEAWRLFTRVRPEVVFMDLSLKPRVELLPLAGRDGAPLAPFPDPVEGGEILAKRMLYQEPSTKLVICTGHAADSRSVREVVKFGAYCVLFKPISLPPIRRVFQLLAADGLTISGSRADEEMDHGPEGAWLAAPPETRGKERHG